MVLNLFLWVCSLSKTSLEMTTEQLLARMLKFAEALTANCQYRGKKYFLIIWDALRMWVGIPKAMPDTDLDYCVYWKNLLIRAKTTSENDTNLIPENLTLNSSNSIYLWHLLKGWRSRHWANWRTWIYIINITLAYDLLKISAPESTFSKFDLISERMLL